MVFSRNQQHDGLFFGDKDINNKFIRHITENIGTNNIDNIRNNILGKYDKLFKKNHGHQPNDDRHLHHPNLELNDDLPNLLDPNLELELRDPERLLGKRR